VAHWKETRPQAEVEINAVSKVNRAIVYPSTSRPAFLFRLALVNGGSDPYLASSILRKIYPWGVQVIEITAQI
jgi:hypothetical protein